MRLARYLICVTAVLAALGVADAKLATADAPDPLGILRDLLDTRHRRRERRALLGPGRAGNHAHPSSPDETCTVTE